MVTTIVARKACVMSLTFDSDRRWGVGGIRTATMTTHARKRVHRPTTLDPDEQSELAIKLRYGIGLEQLVGEADAKFWRENNATLPPMPPWRGRQEPERQLPYPPRADHRIRERAAALGLGVGRRGQWLRR